MRHLLRRNVFNYPEFFVSAGVVLDKLKMKVFVLLIALSFAAKQNKDVVESEGHYGENVHNGESEEIRVKIEEDEYAKVNATNNLSFGTGHQNILRKKNLPRSSSA